MKVDPIIFFDASGLAMDSGVSAAPAIPIPRKALIHPFEPSFHNTHG
jgi:hypothetical protein